MQSEHKAGKETEEWKNTLFLLWRKTTASSRNVNWLGSLPWITAVCRELQLSLTLSRGFKLKAASTQTFFIVRDTGAALTHTPLEPHSPVPHTRAALSQATAIWGIPMDPEGC